MPRPLMSRAIELISKNSGSQVPRVVIEAPTGYGKSVGAPLVYSVLRESGLVESFQHVLPLRSIVRDVYVCTLLAALESAPRDLCNGRTPPKEVAEALARPGLTVDNIAYQMGDLIVGEASGGHDVFNKQPLFDAEYVVTTLDSFLYNLFRVPVTEIASTKKHYAIPRLRIFIGGVYFDEAHMVFEEENEVSTIYTAAKKAFEVVTSFKSPLVIASATMGKRVLESIRGILGGGVKIVKLGPLDREEGSLVEVSDRDFVDLMTSFNWKTRLIESEEAVERAIEHANTGLKVLVVRDSVRSAVETYKELEKTFDNVVLIHGKMTRGDRERALALIKRMRRPGIAVSTSVIEAGVNVSFDVLVTDGLRPRSVVQRTGRVCRDGECDTAYVYVVKIADHEVPADKRLLEYIESAQNSQNEICWRIPFDLPSQKCEGYEKLLDQLEEPRHDSVLERALKSITSPLFVSSSDINYVLNSMDYALTRVGLVEIVVGDVDEVKNWCYNDLVLHGLTLSGDVVEDLLLSRSDCIKGVVALWGDRCVSEVELVCAPGELIVKRSRDGKPRFSTRKFVDCTRKAHRLRRDQPPMHVGLLVSRNCYVEGLGLVY